GARQGIRHPVPRAEGRAVHRGRPLRGPAHARGVRVRRRPEGPLPRPDRRPVRARVPAAQGEPCRPGAGGRGGAGGPAGERGGDAGGGVPDRPDAGGGRRRAGDLPPGPSPDPPTPPPPAPPPPPPPPP